MTINHGEHMHYYIKPKFFFDSLGDVQPSQPYSYTYGDRPVFEFSFLPNEIAEGDTLVFAVDNDMVFYDNAPSNLLHSASCMVVVRHDVTAEEATAGKVQLRIETRTVKFRDVTNGKVRPVEVISGLYRRRGDGDDLSYVLLAKGRAFANGIIADYDALPEPITIDEYYTKGDIDGLLGEKADAATLVAHTDNADIHVTLQDKTTWDSKADVTDIGNATVTITQGGVSKGSFSVNASEDVTIDLTGGGAQADWNETDTSSPSYIQNKPSVYTKTDTDGMLNEKADKATTYTRGETDGLLNEKANVATTLSGYGIQDAYTKTETDGLLDAKADAQAPVSYETLNQDIERIDLKGCKCSTEYNTQTNVSGSFYLYGNNPSPSTISLVAGEEYNVTDLTIEHTLTKAFTIKDTDNISFEIMANVFLSERTTHRVIAKLYHGNDVIREGLYFYKHQLNYGSITDIMSFKFDNILKKGNFQYAIGDTLKIVVSQTIAYHTTGTNENIYLNIFYFDADFSFLAKNQTLIPFREISGIRQAIISYAPTPTYNMSYTTRSYSGSNNTIYFSDDYFSYNDPVNYSLGSDTTFDFGSVTNAGFLFKTGSDFTYTVVENSSYPMVVNKPIDFKPDKTYLIVIYYNMLFWTEVEDYGSSSSGN